MANTLADRNNNPGNIRYNSNIPWQEKIPGGGEGGFEGFTTPEHGVRAAAKNLYTSQERYGNNSVASIVSQWAPPGENPTDAYISKVANDLGVDPYADLGSLRDNPQLTADLVKSMTNMEGGTVGADGKYTDNVIKNGVALANGTPESDITFSEQDTDHNPNLYSEAENNTDEIDTSEAAAESSSSSIATVSDIITPNWLSTVDSPTYRWTLYIVDNETFNNPSSLGNDDALLNSKKAFIIAKTGETTEFSIDNFACISVVTPGQRHGNTTPGIIQFDLFETLGFTFLDKALKAGIVLNKPASLHSQNYILKLEFLGRDAATGGSTIYPGTFLYPVKLNQIRSTTGPEGTRYNIVAWSIIKHAQTESVTDTPITIKSVTTVKDFAEGLEKAYNTGIIDGMNPKDYKEGTPPPKQIKIVFDKSSRIVSRPNTITAKLDSFDLKYNAWGEADGSGGPRSFSDVNSFDVTIERETNLSMSIAELIEKNCIPWQNYVIKSQEEGLTPYITVDPIYAYPPRAPRKYYANLEPILITYHIKIGISTSTPNLSIAEHNKQFKDASFQTSKINSLPIEKSYTFLYSGLNTEVINYQIDLEGLYVVVDTPASGVYRNGKDADGEEQFVSTELTSPYLEDIPQGSISSGFNNLVVGGTAKADSADNAQVNEISKNNIAAISSRASQMAKREFDAYQFDLEIKGDPYWMGNMQATIKGKLQTPDYSTRDALISFVQYNPNADKLLTEQTKGPVDIVSSGIYKLTKIESRFQGGRFTQSLSGYKDVTTNTSLVLNKLIDLSEKGGG